MPAQAPTAFADIFDPHVWGDVQAMGKVELPGDAATVKEERGVAVKHGLHQHYAAIDRPFAVTIADVIRALHGLLESLRRQQNRCIRWPSAGLGAHNAGNATTSDR